MEAQRKSNGSNAIFIHKHHLCLHDLKMHNQHLRNIYLLKTNVPEYPQPEFHVSNLKHDTQQGGLLRIWKDEGFKDPHGGLKDPDSLSLVWWSLAVGPQEIQSAETRLLDKFYPNRMEKQAEKKPSYLDVIYPDLNKQESFLWKFATSPAFGEKSRFGSYRFTFPLKDVVTAYSQQFCSGAPPMIKVFKTSLYNQEVQYSVLVHSPAREKLFSEYPLLAYDDPNAVFTYRDGHFIWRSQAMCETHSWKLIQNPYKNQMEADSLCYESQFYVWDNVAIALHVEHGQVLKFDSDQLRENLKFCEPDRPTITPNFYFDHFENAKILVNQLWPDSDSLLEEEPSLELSFKALFLSMRKPKRIKDFTEV
ncbi:ragulator complex protein LAMTOR3 [Sarotherodon galilaeus]